MPEKVLCADFGVSRTPLREVLKMLSVKGLVSLPPDRGASVVCITQQEAEDLILLLGTMESHASELACIRIDAARITHIKNCTGNCWKIIVPAASKSARAADALIVFEDPWRGGG